MKYIKYLLILLPLFNSCRKEEILEVTENTGKIYGYSMPDQTTLGKAASFNIVNTNEASSATKSTIPRTNTYSAQAMYLPSGEYVVPVPYNLVNNKSLSKFITVDTKTFVVDSILTQSASPVVAPVYSPVNQNTYAILNDTLFSFFINREITPKAIIKINKIPGLNMKFSPFNYSTTAHGTLSYIYIAAGGTLRRYDVNTNTFTTILAPTPTIQISLYGIRYNPFDDKIYFIEAYNGLVALFRLDPATNKIEQVVEIYKGGIVAENFTATIHCCENKYIFFEKRTFYVIDIAAKTIKTVPTKVEYQGLIWANN